MVKNIMSLLAMAAAVLLATVQRGRGEELGMEDVLLNDKLLSVVRSEGGKPFPLEGGYYTRMEDAGIVVVDYETGAVVDTLCTFSELRGALAEKRPSMYRVSPDGKWLLLGFDAKPIYRRSVEYSYTLYNRERKEFFPIGSGEARDAMFSPDAKQVAYVEQNNLYVVSLGKAGAGMPTAVTTDGVRNSIINGHTDWVYEEEFAFTRAYEWAPDGAHIAFLRFDEHAVKEYVMPVYGEGPYPTMYSYKYPKVGEKNSVVTLHIYDVRSGKTLRADVGEETDQYIARLQWISKERLLALRLNREQNCMDLLLVEAKSGQSRVAFRERNNRYVEEPEDATVCVLPGGKQYVITSERDGYRHLYLQSFGDSTSAKQLTEGEDEVRQVYGYDAARRRMVYQRYAGPLRTEVCAVGVNGGREVVLSKERGMNSARFSADYSHYELSNSTLQSPPRVSIHNANGKELRLVADNHEVRVEAERLGLPRKEFFSFVTPEGVQLNGYMIKPIDFDAKRRYPVLFDQYSGPNSQRVLDEWSVGWNDYIAARGCIVVCVDGRGTGGRGEEFRKQTYGKLGDLESADQISAAHYVASLPYVDASKIGIWGWSYGGYMSSLSLFRGQGVFKMAIAVAPVTNWRYYNTIYTERYMGQLSANAAGYDAYCPIGFAHLLRGALLIVHGTGDDNVHYQNSMQLANALIAAGRDFDMITYPDRNHSINTEGARMHLYRHLTQYVERHLFGERGR